MRIGVLTHNYPRFPGDFSGSFIQHLCEELAQQGEEVHIIAPYDAAYTPDALAVANPRLHLYRYAWSDASHQLGYMRTMQADVRMRLNTYALSPALFLRGIQFTKKIASERQLHILHAHWLLPNGYIASFAARQLGIPLVVSIPGSDALVAGQNPLFRYMARIAFDQAGLITANSTSLQEVATTDLGADPDKFELVIYAVNPDVLRPDPRGTESLRRQLRIPEDAFLFLAVGRMVYKKGFDVMLHALSELQHRNPITPMYTIFVGDGDLWEAWQGLGQDLQLENIHWVGRIPNNEIGVYYNAADVLVMPSVTRPADGLNVCVLDAMSCAKPVIGSDCAGNDLVIQEGVNGMIVPEGDAVALAGAMAALAADPVRVQAMGRASRGLIETKYGWPQIARQYRLRFRELISNRQ
ncbi:MAG: glycosyltransferase family 4 protein [Chloroflexi bacterium]|nr:glycosyltransferase family 4 protein [Chloroflexota bacterium]